MYVCKYYLRFKNQNNKNYKKMKKKLFICLDSNHDLNQ